MSYGYGFKRPFPPACGQNVMFSADRLGCGKQILSWPEVYRCTHCDVPFHKECAEKHFVDDRGLTEEDIENAMKNSDKWSVPKR